MRIQPNRSELTGRVLRVEPAPDGHGAEIAVAVESCAPEGGKPDFLQAAPGSTVMLFAAEVDEVAAGRRYTLSVTVLGGPRGERAVLQAARPA